MYCCSCSPPAGVLDPSAAVSLVVVYQTLHLDLLEAAAAAAEAVRHPAVPHGCGLQTVSVTLQPQYGSDNNMLHGEYAVVRDRCMMLQPAQRAWLPQQLKATIRPVQPQQRTVYNIKTLA